MGAVYRSICFEVDTLTLHVTSLVEKEVHRKVEIEKLMNEGFVNIAKARYIMGSTCITKMQLPTEKSNPIKPVATVCRKEINNNWVFKIDRKTKHKEVPGSEILKDDLENFDCSNKSSNSTSKISINTTKSETQFKNMLQTDPKSIKKSKNAYLVKDELFQEYQNDLLDEISNTDSNESLISVSDPIRLFGVLVPNTLKQAQIIFSDAVDLLGECATIQTELKNTLTKLYHLRNVKKLIEDASRDAKIDFLAPKVYWTPSTTSSVSCYPLEAEGEIEDYYKPGTHERKSIRSVFYDDKDIAAQEYQEAEYQESVFGSGSDSDY